MCANAASVAVLSCFGNDGMRRHMSVQQRYMEGWFSKSADSESGGLCCERCPGEP